MKKSIVRVVLVASAAVAALTPAIANHSWNGYHWAGDGQNLTVRVNTATTAVWNTAVTEAISDWNQSTELTLPGPVAVSVNRRKCNPIAGQVLVCNDSYGQRGWLGIASIWLSNGHISQGTTKLNDTYFNTAQYNTPAWRAMVACQEIGHDFGLGHTNEIFNNTNDGTCMDYTNAPDGGVVGSFDYGANNRHPNGHDYSMLNTVYNHDDGYMSANSSTNFGIRQVGQAPSRALPSEGSGDSPAEWGRAIHKDGEGRPDVFVKDLGAGHKVITHVFWAIGEGPKGHGEH